MQYKIDAHKLLAYTTEQLWQLLEGDNILLHFSDGEVITNHREIIYSSYVWDFIRRYPKTPLLLAHHVSSVMKSGELPSQAHLRLINNVFWSVYDAYSSSYSDLHVLLDELSLLAYQTTNRMYNELSTRLEAHVTSLDITDFTQVTKDPVIEKMQLEAEVLISQLYDNDFDPANKTLVAGLQATAEAKLDEVNTAIMRQIQEAPELKENPLAIAIRTGISRLGQAMQCLGPRGFVTDVDSVIFPKPITRGYIHGIRSLYGSMIESRSAAKALMNTTKPLQDSEYFSRRQQLVTMNIRNLHMCDCGSDKYLVWHVRDKRTEGLIELNDDLETLAGKFYLDEDTGKLKVVHKSDKHLIGKTIQLRSITAGCNHPDPNGVCYVCFGETGLALPANSNLGHSACVTMTAILGQLILSTKHHESSATVEGVNLNSRPIEKKFLTAETNGNTFYLSERLKGKTVKLLVNADNAKGLPDLRLVTDVNQVNLERTSQFEVVRIAVFDGTAEVETSLDVRVQHRFASLSHEMLAYIKRKGFQISKDIRDTRYVFDMSEWDFKDPLFVLPMRHFNMSHAQKEIAEVLESTAEEMEKRSKFVQPLNLLVEFHDLVNRHISVNLSVLDAIVYSAMVVNTDEPNYDLPKPWTSSGLGVLRLLLSNRSLSAMMGYQNHRQTFTDPSSFVVRNRLDHPFDCIFAPAEVLSHEAKQTIKVTY